jgi:hypothetical protein
MESRYLDCRSGPLAGARGSVPWVESTFVLPAGDIVLSHDREGVVGWGPDIPQD